MRILLVDNHGRIIPDWADDPLNPRKFDHNAVELPRYAGIEASLTGQTQSIIGALQRGDITKRSAVFQFREALLQHETEAFIAGRRARGDARDDLTDGELKMLSGRHARNMRYFVRFCDDVQNGRGRMPYMQRARAYGESLWSIYTRGETSDWEDPEKRNVRYHWILDPDAEHCPDCLARAKRSRDNNGFSWEEMVEMGWPGEGTICLYKCRCHVRVVKGPEGVADQLPRIDPSDTPQHGLQVFEGLLGGQGLPGRIPAAGLPFAKADPRVVERSLFVSGDDADELSRKLPTVLNTLITPSSVHEADGIRVYQGMGLAAALQRGLEGIWHLILVILGHAKEAQ